VACFSPLETPLSSAKAFFSVFLLAQGAVHYETVSLLWLQYIWRSMKNQYALKGGAPAAGMPHFKK
jgi:hypothetical protein